MLTEENDGGTSKKRNKSLQERTADYIKVLKGLSDGIDVITGEVIEGLSEDTRSELYEMSVYFERRLKMIKQQEIDNPNRGQKWTHEEDEQLLSEYNSGKSVKEISEVHCRSVGAIRSRLLKFGIVV